MRTINTTVYFYNELNVNDAAKKNARDWWIKSSHEDDFWQECVFDDTKAIGVLMGIEIKNIYFRGFSSQGDGACFEGTWRADKVQENKVKEYAPKDQELNRIANEFEKMAKQFPFASFYVKQSGHYYHENCADFSVAIIDINGDEIMSAEAKQAEEILVESAKDFMRWIYKTLEKEYEYQISEKNVEEIILANNYEFTEDGRVI